VPFSFSLFFGGGGYLQWKIWRCRVTDHICCRHFRSTLNALTEHNMYFSAEERGGCQSPGWWKRMSPGWGIYSRLLRPIFFHPFCFYTQKIIWIWKSPPGLNEEHLTQQHKAGEGWMKAQAQKNFIQSPLLEWVIPRGQHNAGLWTSTHQCTIHWMPLITQLWMNLKWVGIWFHLGNQLCKK